MKRYLAFLWTAALLVAVAGCSKPEASSKADSNVDYYTCTMHPSVHSKDPGKCPICSMDLVPVMKKGTASAAAAPAQLSSFSVPVERQQQIGVTYAEAERRPLKHEVRAVGFVVPDKSREWQFVARTDGYVQKLFVTSPGQIVEKDEPLLSIYSPDLLTAEREFVELLRTGASSDGLIKAAEQRLLQWNVTPEQIAALERSRKPEDTLTLMSPFRGIVQSVPMAQGQGVKIGDLLVDVVDLSVVWVWADFYEDELRMLQAGQKVSLTARSYPGETFEGKISVINPFLDEMKRTAKVRIDIANPNDKLRPGMYMNIALSMNMGEGLTIPVSAVMPTGGRDVVFVDKGEGMLEPRLVKLGGTYGDWYEVLTGLQPGERVVSSANFLIDAEAKVQGALQSFEEKPEGSEGGKMEEAAPSPEMRALYEPLIATYLALHADLAGDKFDDVSQETESLRNQVGKIASADTKPAENADAYQQKIAALNAAAEKFKPANLEEARMQFGQFSAPLIALLTQFPTLIEHPLSVMECPMWQKSPARWIQAGKTVENPFLGQAMADCGANVGSLPASK